jgi:phage shock protein C
MSSTKRTSEWTVLLGVALLGIGFIFLVERVFGWLFVPLSRVLHIVGNVGWPLLLVGLGVLLIMGGRSGGFATHGRLFRSRTDRKIGGVLGGAAVFFGVDASLLRLGFVVATVLTGFWFGFLLYVIAMVVVPEEFAVGVQREAPAAPPVPPQAAAHTTAQAPQAPPATSSAV